MYRYVGTAGGGGRLLRDAGEIADELTAMRRRLADILAKNREIEGRQAALAACHEGDPAGITALREITEELCEVQDEMLAISDECDVLRDELCEALYYARVARVF